MSSTSSRRGFLAAGASALAAPAFTAASAASAQGATSTPQLKLGVASYSFREFSRRLCIKYTQALKVQYLDVKSFHLPLESSPEEIDKAKRDFEKAGLTLTAAGNVTMQKDDDAELKMIFEYAKRAGFPILINAPSHQTLPRIEKFVKQYDIKTALHNHGPEDKHFPSPFDALKAVKDMDPRMGLCIDVGHTVRCGVDVVEAIRAAGSRLYAVHIKDLADLKQRDSQVDVGDGAIPIPAIFKELIKMNYQGCVDLEYEINGDDPLPGMQKSFAYMRGVLAGLANSAA